MPILDAGSIFLDTGWAEFNHLLFPIQNAVHAARRAAPGAPRSAAAGSRCCGQGRGRRGTQAVGLPLGQWHAVHRNTTNWIIPYHDLHQIYPTAPSTRFNNNSGLVEARARLIQFPLEIECYFAGMEGRKIQGAQSSLKDGSVTLL